MDIVILPFFSGHAVCSCSPAIDRCTWCACSKTNQSPTWAAWQQGRGSTGGLFRSQLEAYEGMLAAIALHQRHDASLAAPTGGRNPAWAGSVGVFGVTESERVATGKHHFRVWDDNRTEEKLTSCTVALTGGRNKFVKLRVGLD